VSSHQEAKASERTYHLFRVISDWQQSLSHMMNLVTLMSWITRNALLGFDYLEHMFYGIWILN
jgi:hypothetical protein